MSVPFNKAKKKGGPQRGNHDAGGRGPQKGGQQGGKGPHGGHGGPKGPKGPQHGGGKGPHGQQPGQGQAMNVMRTMLKLVFEKQQAALYIDDVLHLNNFRDCPDLAQVKGSINFDTAGFCDNLCSVVKEYLPDVKFINVADNNIRQLSHLLQALIQHNLHHVIRGISAYTNKIDNFECLKHLSKFRNLTEVGLAGNPVANQPNYRKTVASRLPQLTVLDGEGLERPALTLPWPLPSQLPAEAVPLLQNLEQLLHVLGTQGPDAAGLMYHVSSYYSVSMPNDAAFRCSSNAKDAQQALAAMKNDLKNRNRNTYQITGATANKVAKGRSEVCVALLKTVYPRDFQVLHEFDPNADVQFLHAGAGVKVSMAMVTVHGIMTWRHRSQPDDDINFASMCFDRTFVLVQDPDWIVVNDCLTLRNREPTAVLLYTAPHKVEALATKFGLPANIMGAVVGVATSDADLAMTVGEISTVGEAGLHECAAAVNQDAGRAIRLARVVARTGIAPSQAVQALTAAGDDVDAASARLLGQ